jgi:hypothetical protein
MVWAMNSGHPGSQNQRRYVGQYVEDQRNGRGEMTYPNGDRYTGTVSTQFLDCLNSSYIYLLEGLLRYVLGLF